MKTRLLILTCGLFASVTACGGAQPGRTAGHAGSATSPAAAAPVTSAAAPTPPPVTCGRLPVINDNPTLPAGFLDVETGRFTADPSSTLTSIGGDLDRTGGSPPLVGWPAGWPTYAAGGRWVPALPGWVSPDGTAYVYPSTAQPAIHVVDVRSATDRVLTTRKLYPVQWTADGIYVMDWPSGNPAGVYLLSPSSGRVQPIAAKLSSVTPVSGGAAWLTEVAPGVPSRSGSNGPMADRLTRTDLGTGRSSAWYTEADSYLSLLGFATDGSPLLLARSAGGAELLRVKAPGDVAERYTIEILSTVATDRRGTWMTQSDGTVLLYQVGAAPRKMGKGPAGLKPAGGCAETASGMASR
jgi:hypothetical protein